MGDLLANKLWSVPLSFEVRLVTVEITNMFLNFTLWRTLRVDFLQPLPFSGGGGLETSPYVSLPALCVENRLFRKSKIVNCCFRILQCFHWISDEFNDIVMNFSKRVFSWEIARCFFWHLSRLLAKTEDLRVDTCAAKSRPFLVLTFKCLSETIWRRDLLVQVNRCVLVYFCFYQASFCALFKEST